MKITSATVWSNVEKIRKAAPVIHNITNFVVMNTTANALLAIGASPVMAHAEDEVADMVEIASALVINIGTFSDHWIKSMFKAAEAALSKGIPIILDPVGSGATPYRTRISKNLINTASPAIIRGNASEILSLVDDKSRTKGVDSLASSFSALDAAIALNRQFGSAVCISGETDIIVDWDSTIKISNGHEMMSKVTGLGCTASALCGAFAAVDRNYADAAASAMAIMGIAAEIAMEISDGPGTLQVNFIDSLYNIDESDVSSRLKAEG